MNKTLLILFFLFLVVWESSGQSYAFTRSSETYSPLANPDYSIPDTSPYFGNVQTSPTMIFESFGRNYNFGQGMNIPIKQGYLYFVNNSFSTTLYPSKGLYVARPGNNQTSTFSFKESGTAGNTEYVLEWKNMGFRYGDSSDFINFQVHLFEATGVIEYHFGASSVSPNLYEGSANGPTIGLLEMNATFSTIYEQLWLQGDPINPQVVSTSAKINLSGTPDSGTVYRFDPSSVGLHEEVAVQNLVYPSFVSNGELIVQTETGDSIEISIYALSGIAVLSLESVGNGQTLDLSSIPAGMYLVVLSDSDGNLNSQKIFIRNLF